MTINIAIVGAGGKMGRNLVKEVSVRDETNLTLVTEKDSSGFVGIDSGELSSIGSNGVKIQSFLNENFDILIDFTRPNVTLQNINFCLKNNKKMVIGTTGFSDDEKKVIQEASQEIAIVLAPNMSVGVNLCYKLLEIASKTIGNESDIEILEYHHNAKVDAPSGTSLALGEVVANSLDRNLEEDGVFARHGIVGPRSKKEIGFSTVRGGSVVGDHYTMFFGENETVEINHKASSRSAFAQGALRASIWLSGKDKGLFDMQDVLGFN